METILAYILAALISLFPASAPVEAAPATDIAPAAAAAEYALPYTESTSKDPSPACLGDELCYTNESQTKADELWVEAGHTFDTKSSEYEWTYTHTFVGYYDAMPNMSETEYVIEDSKTGRHYVYNITANALFLPETA